MNYLSLETVLSEAKLLSQLTFIGGTYLRACYGSDRLSEDLNFAGGADFKRSDQAELGDVLTDRLETRYGLPVKVSEPVKTGGNVSAWKMRIEMRPGQRHLPSQRIHVAICAIPSHDRRPMMLRNLYEVDMGTSGLILQAQSREEILADKLIAFAFRENRIKNRDLWDIGWLNQRGIEFSPELVPKKIADHNREPEDFVERFETRLECLKSEPVMRQDFVKEMNRFLPASTVRDTIEDEGYWIYLCGVIEEQGRLAMGALG